MNCIRWSVSQLFGVFYAAVGESYAKTANIPQSEDSSYRLGDFFSVILQ